MTSEPAVAELTTTPDTECLDLAIEALEEEIDQLKKLRETCRVDASDYSPCIRRKLWGTVSLLWSMAFRRTDVPTSERNLGGPTMNARTLGLLSVDFGIVVEGANQPAVLKISEPVTILSEVDALFRELNLAIRDRIPILGDRAHPRCLETCDYESLERLGQVIATRTGHRVHLSVLPAETHALFANQTT